MGANFFLDNEDLRFQFEHGIKWKEIVELTERGYTLPGGHANIEEAKEFYRAVMESVGEFAGEFMAPRVPAIDRESNHLVDGEVVFGKALGEIVDGLRERELFGMPVPRELGGSNCPLVMFFSSGELLARADVSVMTHFSFHGGIAMALLMYAAKEGNIKVKDGEVVEVRWEQAVREIAAGKAWGSMDLTESDAGSDLGRIRTRAEQRDGKWYLTGEKIFITSGHGQYHLVLAKTDMGTGGDAFDALKKLGLFMVPRVIERDGKQIQNVIVTKVEEKVGHHGSATCSLSFENSEAELVGKPTQGFELMLSLMNNARVGVGFEAIGLAEAAYRAAKAYASERKTMGQTIDRHPVIAEMLMDMELEIVGLRALAIEAGNQTELASKIELLLQVQPPSDAEELKQLKRSLSRHKRRARLLTPLLKMAAAEAAVRISRNCMQVHGGAGYISEVGVDKLLRDALVLPVYEGTTQIQALMALKDAMMNALSNPGPFARRAGRATLLATTSSTETERLFYKADASVQQVLFTLVARIASDKLKRTIADKGWTELPDMMKVSTWDPKADFAEGLLHAERFAKALADVESARILMDQASRHPERKKIADRFVHRMAPRVEALTSSIQANDRSVFDWIAELPR